MKKTDLKLKIASNFSTLLIFIFTMASCAPASNFNSRLNAIVQPYRFSTFNWEVAAITNSIYQSVHGPAVSTADSQKVIDYFTAIEQGQSVAADTTNEVERIISLQIRDILKSEGINNPFQSGLSFLNFDFPPINLTLGTPPYILIISPRDKIENSDSIMLLQYLTTAQMETIESEAEKLNVSALVTEIGGLGATFPVFVNAQTNISGALNAATEEWLHQYLAFTPLGSRYVTDLLGMNRNYDIVTMNETVASMVSEEIGGLVYNKYYASYEKPQPAAADNNTNTAPAFDFNAAMRNIRVNVDTMLAAGQIDQSEQYMNAQRDYLQTQGYYIRKLNQAYFAFYGSYAESETSVNPIGAEIQGIRSNSTSIIKFLDEVSKVTSVAELEKLNK